MNAKTRRLFLAAALGGLFLGVSLAYLMGKNDALTDVAKSQVPAAAVKVWSGSVMVNGEKLVGTVYEVTDASGRPVARYTVERGNPVPFVTKF